jgi:hypothetical protein
VEGRGDYPNALRAQPACFSELDPSSTGGSSVFVIDRECLR